MRKNWTGTVVVAAIAANTCAFAADAPVPARGDPLPVATLSIPTFTISATVDPLYSTNAASTRIAQDDFLVRALLHAKAEGQAWNLFNYEFFVATRNDRFAELSLSNADLALGGFTFRRNLESFVFRLVGTSVTVFDDYFSRKLVSMFDLGGSVARPIPLLGQWQLTPAVKVIRRFADVATSERVEVGSSIGIGGPLWTGEFSAALAYGIRPYDVGGRDDHNVVVNAVWVKKVNENFAYSLVAKYENNSSNIPLRSFEAFEIGPSFKVSFSSTMRRRRCNRQN